LIGQAESPVAKPQANFDDAFEKSEMISRFRHIGIEESSFKQVLAGKPLPKELTIRPGKSSGRESSHGQNGYLYSKPLPSH
jgi:hypothetical protein